MVPTGTKQQRQHCEHRTGPTEPDSLSPRPRQGRTDNAIQDTGHTHRQHNRYGRHLDQVHEVFIGLHIDLFCRRIDGKPVGKQQMN